MFTQNRYRVYVTGRTNMDQHTKPNPTRLGKQADYYYLSETPDPNRTETKTEIRPPYITSTGIRAVFTPLLTRMHELIARILSATFSNDQLPLPTIHSFLLDFWMRYFCTDYMFTLSVFSFLYCFSMFFYFVLYGCFLSLFFCLF